METWEHFEIKKTMCSLQIFRNSNVKYKRASCWLTPAVYSSRHLSMCLFACWHLTDCFFQELMITELKEPPKGESTWLWRIKAQMKDVYPSSQFQWNASSSWCLFTDNLPAVMKLETHFGGFPSIGWTKVGGSRAFGSEWVTDFMDCFYMMEGVASKAFRLYDVAFIFKWSSKFEWQRKMG